MNIEGDDDDYEEAKEEEALKCDDDGLQMLARHQRSGVNFCSCLSVQCEHLKILVSEHLKISDQLTNLAMVRLEVCFTVVTNYK